MALYLIGLGLHGAKGLPLLGLEVAKKVDALYLEEYTTPNPQGLVEELKELVGREVKVVGREFVEDGKELLEKASKGDVALLVLGDPIVATTHLMLRVKAAELGIRSKVIHAGSIFPSLLAETGLHFYSFGKPVTITVRGQVPLYTAYEVLYSNLVRGLHTLLLLEYDERSHSGVKPSEAMKWLLEVEQERRREAFTEEVLLLVCSRLGAEDQSITLGKVGELMKREYGPSPHTLVVPGELHFTEIEALRALLGVEGEIRGNSQRVKGKAWAMLERYTLKTREALRRARGREADWSRARLEPLFENIECYTSDAERFLRMGEEELAILSMGYAEGLLDALRLLGAMNIEW